MPEKNEKKKKEPKETEVEAITNSDIIGAIRELTTSIKDLAEKVEKIYVKSYQAGKF